MIINKLKNKLGELNKKVYFKNYEELADNNYKINYIETQIGIMTSISNVISKRKSRGAGSKQIEKYKQSLIDDVWKDNKLVKQHIIES